MPTDLAETVQKFIASPPGQLVAGATLAGIVWKFFERVEAVLTDQTKFEIAVWLVDLQPSHVFKPSWHDTFIKVFDRVFGSKHLSWKCFAQSACLSFACFGLTVAWLESLPRPKPIAGMEVLTEVEVVNQ